MNIAVWVIFSIVTLLWTAGTFITVKLTQWGTGLLANGNIDPLSRSVAEITRLQQREGYAYLRP